MPNRIASFYAILNKAFPLDMSQYFRLLNSSRLPKPGRDELLTDPSANQLAVMRNGHIYVFDVFDKNGLYFQYYIINWIFCLLYVGTSGDGVLGCSIFVQNDKMT